MKRVRTAAFLLLLLALCAGGVWLTLQATAEYPPLGAPVSYPVNQVDGFVLTIKEPSWSPFKGYSISWQVDADSPETYFFVHDGKAPNSFEFLERCVDGQWHRLGYLQDEWSFTTLDFALGGDEGLGLSGTIVQKHANYGTRLEPGAYRVVLEMQASDGTAHYLTAPFSVE